MYKMRSSASTKKLIIGIVLLVIFVAALLYVIYGVKNGLPSEGQWKGNIHQWKPAFAGQGLLIILIGIAGSLSFFVGIILTILALRGE